MVIHGRRPDLRPLTQHGHSNAVTHEIDRSGAAALSLSTPRKSAARCFTASEVITSKHLEQGPAYKRQHQKKDDEQEHREDHEAHQAAAQRRPNRWGLWSGVGCSSGHAAGARSGPEDLQHSCRTDIAHRGALVACTWIRIRRSLPFSAAPGFGAGSGGRWRRIGARGCSGRDRRPWTRRSGRRNGPCRRTDRIAEFRAALRTCGGIEPSPGLVVRAVVADLRLVACFAFARGRLRGTAVRATQDYAGHL